VDIMAVGVYNCYNDPRGTRRVDSSSIGLYYFWEFSMEIIPVIEVRSGKSTRSTYVRSDQPNILRDDVLLIAKRWKDEGATRLHIHDVDAARVGMPQNRDQVRDIVRRIGLPVQFSGGVRSPEVMERVLGWGVDRVIADTDVTLNLTAKALINQMGGRVALEFKAFNGNIPRPGAPGGLAHQPVHFHNSPHPATWLDACDFARDMNMNQGWPRFIYRVSLGDGGIAPPEGDAIAKFIQQARKPVCVYAKFRTWDELRAVQKAGPEAIIIHEALYDGSISLPDLINWAKNAGNAPQRTSPGLKPWMPGYKPGAAPPEGEGQGTPVRPPAAGPSAPIVGTPRLAVPTPPVRPASQRPPIPPLPPLPPKRSK
jgi:phosphoribosylformimino-5-aminoimidazole carboxamide ribotide isomerase